MAILFVGLSTLDIQYLVDEFPKSNVKVKTNEPNLLVGGPATNAAVVNAFLDGESVLLSGVGKSPFLSVFENDFRNCNIRHFDFHSDIEQLPVLASVITSTTNGDRNIFTYNPKPSENNFDINSVWESVKPDLVLTDGFYPEITIPLCKKANVENVPVVFDGGSWKPNLDDLLPLIDYAICSANFHPPDCKSNDDVINYLKSNNIKNVAITNGFRSIIFHENENTKTIGVQKVNAVDSLGAGDFFHGAFCFFIRQNNSFENALKKASVLASKTCEYQGTRDWLTKMKKESFL